MRLLLTLYSPEHKPVIPINYQYPLSAAIYKVIQKADTGYAAFLHNTGYGKSGSAKQFKLFTFSDIRGPFAPPTNDRLYLKSQEIKVIVCFHVPHAAESFVKGLFMNQQLEIADTGSRSVFTIRQVEALPSGLSAEKNTPVLLQPISPIVTGVKNDRGHYDYRSPQDVDYTTCLLHNWIEKYLAANPDTEETAAGLRNQVALEVELLTKPPQERKPIIKAGTSAASKLRGIPGLC
ncbi:hypothetical protein [Paraflavitalea speifideaquila]|uniref:hypothetical protein n=1 Tax=Paraflavitalea speifideaquila TaxID=3076558 RepID=UPI0028EE12DE|nr:hypothetical protein [Paraflavitalea speifideiaquila]